MAAARQAHIGSNARSTIGCRARSRLAASGATVLCAKAGREARPFFMVGESQSLRSVYERLANGGDSRDLVLHDLVWLRRRVARRDLLQLAECVLEVAALALLHRLLGIPKADGGHHVVFSQGAIPANEPGLVVGGARHVLSQPGRLRLGVFADPRDGQASCLWSLVRLLLRLHLAHVPGRRLGEDVLQLGNLLLVVAAGFIREQRLLGLPEAQEDGLPLGVEAKAQAFEALLLSRCGEDRLGEHLHTRPNMTLSSDHVTA